MRASAVRALAEALKAEFLAHAMSETFIADLTKAVDDFEAAIQKRENGKNPHTWRGGGASVGWPPHAAARQLRATTPRRLLRQHPP